MHWTCACCIAVRHYSLPCTCPASRPPLLEKTTAQLAPFLLQWYLRKYYFNPVGLGKMPPTGRLDEQDWSGERGAVWGAARVHLQETLPGWCLLGWFQSCRVWQSTALVCPALVAQARLPCSLLLTSPAACCRLQASATTACSAWLGKGA